MNATGAGRDVQAGVRERIARSCLSLDEERFDDWLALCAPEIRYAITAYSPELRREMTWLDHDRGGLERLFATLPHHERDDASLFRAPSVVSVQEDSARAHALTSVIIVRIAPLGTAELFAAVRYHDVWTLNGTAPLLASRRVHMHSRVLLSDSGGSHVIL